MDHTMHMKRMMKCNMTRSTNAIRAGKHGNKRIKHITKQDEAKHDKTHKNWMKVKLIYCQIGTCYIWGVIVHWSGLTSRPRPPSFSGRAVAGH